MTPWPDQMYRLLPAVHQIRDGEHGEALRQVLAILGEQAERLQNDIDSLYDNWFVETCESWVVPYIADLVGYRQVEGGGATSDPNTAHGRSLGRMLYPRREIANLVRRRRRKGALSVLEDVARDVADWPARAVEFVELVHLFQNVRRPAVATGGTLCVRAPHLGVRLNSPFDSAGHTVDVRSIQSRAGVGWTHPQKVGLFVWRRHVTPMTRARVFHQCTQTEHVRCRLFHFDRLGLPVSLYVAPVAETDPFGLAQPCHLPVPLRREALRMPGGRSASATYYGADIDGTKSLAVFTNSGAGDWKVIPASSVLVGDLASQRGRKEAVAELKAPNARVVVDPESGRLLAAEGIDDVRVSFHRARAGRIGGGGYDRALAPRTGWETIRIRAMLTTPDAKCQLLEAVDDASSALKHAQGADQGPPIRHVPWSTGVPGSSPDGRLPSCPSGTSAGAKCAWLVRSNLCIEILDDESYQICADEPLYVADGVTLEIRSSSGHWPLVQLTAPASLDCAGAWNVRLGRGSRLVLDGLQVCGSTMRVEQWANDRSGPADVACSGRPTSSSADAPQPCGDDSTGQARVATIELVDFTTPEPPTPAHVLIRHTTFVPGGRTPEASCHCEPSHASIAVDLAGGRFTILNSIVGTLNVEHPRCCASADPAPSVVCPEDPLSLQIADSIVHAARSRLAVTGECCFPAHADLTIERSTVLGDICVQQFSRGENCLFAGVVHVQRRGSGYLRYCYVPQTEADIPCLDDAPPCRPHQRCERQLWCDWKSPSRLARNPTAVDCCSLMRTPQRFRCLPEGAPPASAIDEGGSCSRCGAARELGCKCNDAATHGATAATGGASVPRFASTTYGDPGYCELALDCPRSILRGADDESELGAYHDNYWPQRGAALEARLQEYTPADFQSTVIYADDLHPAALTSPCRPRRRHNK
jgi:hypothetical protein